MFHDDVSPSYVYSSSSVPCFFTLVLRNLVYSCVLFPQNSLRVSFEYPLRNPRHLWLILRDAVTETTQKVTSINWYSRESRNWVSTESTSSRLQRWSHWLVWGKTKRTKLEFSGWDLHPYILLHVFVHICTGSTNDCSRIFRCLVAWGGSMHQARPWNGKEVEHDATAWKWQNGNEEK